MSHQVFATLKQSILLLFATLSAASVGCATDHEVLTAGVQEYQKGAIYRQMLEYKREKINLELRLQELEKKTVDHDDHIRIIDAWLLEVWSPAGLTRHVYAKTDK